MTMLNEHRLIHLETPKKSLQKPTEAPAGSFERMNKTIDGVQNALDQPGVGDAVRDVVGLAPANPENAIKMPINKERIDSAVAKFNSSDGGQKAKRILAAKLGTEGVRWSADDISKPFNPSSEELQDASPAGGMAQFMLRVTSFISLFSASKMKNGEGSTEGENSGSQSEHISEDLADTIQKKRPQWSELGDTFEAKGVLNAEEKQTFMAMFKEIENYASQIGNQIDQDPTVQNLDDAIDNIYSDGFEKYVQQKNPKYADIIRKLKEEGSWKDVDKILS